MVQYHEAVDHLLIVGASTRAAAFSALRAHLHPWCIDLFNDTDLQARCPCALLPATAYPEGLLKAVRQAPLGPWMYTGSLENRPALIRSLARQRPLWGNDESVLNIVRSPRTLATLLRYAGVPCPQIRLSPPLRVCPGQWLVKPQAGSGGRHITPWTGTIPPHDRPVYFQEFIEGEPAAAVYLGDGRQARLLGVTRQLVGERWLHAAPFHYCGSIGPLFLSPSLRASLERLGNTLAIGSGLRGLFGVDYIDRAGVPWPVEINPRFSASMEILDHAGLGPVLAWHRNSFEPTAPVPAPGSSSSDVIGKAILFAPAPLRFPKEGPWLSQTRQPRPVEELPSFADIPAAGQLIPAGRPILTLFARGDSTATCLEALRERAADLYGCLHG